MNVHELIWSEFSASMDTLAAQIRECLEIRHLDETERKKYRLLGVPRGGLPIAVQLSHILDMKVTTEIDRFTIMVDDIYDSGATSKQYEAMGVPLENQFFWLKREGVPESVQASLIVEPDLWVVFPWERNPKKDKLDYESKNANTH